MKHNFERFCKEPEKIENYEKAKKDNFIGWECHHRLETHNSDGERRLVNISQEELKALRMYYNRPPEELIFLPASEHRAFNKGKKQSEETKKKHSEALKGKPKSDETRRKMKGNKNALGYKHSDETKNKMSLQKTGRHWYNNGKENKFCYECPEGFVPGVLR